MAKQFSNNYEATELVVKYSERIVALIDILGVKNMVKENNSLNKVSKIVNFVRDTIFEHEETLNQHNPFYVEVSFISDSIVISIDAPISADDHRIRTILRIAGGIGLNLLAIGHPCRGSVVAGQIFHYRDRDLNFDAVMGPALVNAYELEQSVAVYPRIVVDSSVYNFWEKYVATEPYEVQDSWREVLKQDQDGEWFINIFNQHIESAAKFLFAQREDYGILKNAGEAISNGLKESKPQTRIRDKYNWLRSQYLSDVSTNGKILN
jgi:hypothetical protein